MLFFIIKFLFSFIINIVFNIKYKIQYLMKVLWKQSMIVDGTDTKWALCITSKIK